MLRSLLALFTLSLLAASCGAQNRPPYVVGIVSSDGNDPIATISSGHVEISVRQLDMPIVMDDAPISGGALDAVDVGITSYGVITRIQVEVFDDAADDPDVPVLIGATPPFVPLGYGFVRVVVGPPSRCEILSAPSLSSDRIAPNLVSVDSNLISIGGIESDEPTSGHVEVLSPVQLTYATAPLEYPALAREIGPGGAMRLASSTMLVALDEIRAAVLYHLEDVTTRDVDLTEATDTNDVHPGAGPQSTLVDLGGEGLAIVGGLQGDEAVTGITWVDAVGRSSTSMLQVARSRPAAIRLGSHILVAGGQAAGQRPFELVAIAAGHAGVATFGDETSTRFGGVLVVDSAAGRAWLGFGEDASGALLDTTVRISGCPSACVATDDTPIALPRRGFAVARRSTETLILGGDVGDAASPVPSGAVDRVRFVSGAPVVEPLGALGAARDRPGAAEIGGGIVIVGGGQGVRPELRALRDLEICFPEVLDPL